MLFLSLLAACSSGSVTFKDSPPGGDDHPETGDSAVDTDTGGGGETGDTVDTDTAPVIEPPSAVVDCEGSGDFMHIQDAIDAAFSGDRIAVLPCVYHERLDFLGKTLEVYGTEGSAETILDADLQGTAVNVETGEADGTRFAGFTVTRGADSADGGGLEVADANVELDDVVFENMGDSAYIIESLTGFVDLTDVTIDGSGIITDGIAILSDGGALTATGLQVDCGGGAAALYHHVSLELTDSTLTCAGGYGLYNYHGEMFIQRSRLTGGVAGIYSQDSESTEEEPDNPTELVWIWNSAVGGGQYGLQILYEDLTIANSVLWGGDAAVSMTAGNPSEITNSVLTGAACGLSSDTNFTVRYTDFHDNAADYCGLAGTAPIAEDPGFIDFPDDLHLTTGSPLIDAGNPSGDWDDADGTRNDVGVYGGPRPMGT